MNKLDAAALKKTLLDELTKPLPPIFQWEERQEQIVRNNLVKELLEKFYGENDNTY